MNEGKPPPAGEGGDDARLASEASEDRFFGLSLDLLSISGLDGYFKRLNPAWERTLGFTIEELLARPAIEFIHPDDRGRSRELGPRIIGGMDIVHFDNRFVCKDGSYRWISWTCSALKPGDQFIYGVGRDVTEVRVAHERLDSKTAELQAVFSALPDLLFRTDAEGRLIDYNAGRTSDLYVSPELFLGKSFSEVLPPTVGRALDAAIKKAHQSGEMESLAYELPMPSGEERYEARIIPFLEGQSIIVVSNVTDRWMARELLKKSEERLRESEKLEAIGRLAGGIAHDFNNLMMAILTYSEILTRRLPTDDPSRRELAEIRGAGKRATRLTRQLLAFAQRQLLMPTVLDPGAIVRDVEVMLKDLIGEHVALDIACPHNLWRVRVDRSQLEQVVLNLALNARDAMPAGGTMSVKAINTDVDEAMAQRLGLPASGEYVELSVADTGRGIGPDELPHLFEPFFTTKGPGAGTGLGLATVYGVVSQSGGSVSVETAPGQGSTFTIFLPRAAEAAESVSVPEPGEPPRGDETVLLAEDEPAVRRAIAEMLRSLGYTVLEAENAEDALRVGSEHRADIHVLLTDVVMPGASGFELASELRSLRPAVRVLFMSGYASESIASAGTESAAVMLQKPFSSSDLAQHLRDALAFEARKKE